MKRDELIRLSKTISYALRHDPESFGLSLEDDGSVKLEDLIKGISESQRPSGQAEGLDVSVLPIGSVAGFPVALHPYG